MTSDTGKGRQQSEGVLLLNPGSSSFKWAAYPSLNDPRPAADGTFAALNDHRELLRLVDECEAGTAIIRFVHGGPAWVRPVQIDSSSYSRLRELETLAPLHNRLSLDCIETLRAQRPGLTLIAVFDTEFFHNLPRAAQMVGLPSELTRKHRIRRFGFHGFAHRDMVRQWQALRDTRGRDRIVTMQLGSGCSMAAVAAGRPIDTTMGFTPNEGLLMSTRSGDIDPGLVTWLQRQEGWGPDATDTVLNEHSGWLGVSGESADMAELLTSRSENARVALELFRHRIRKTLGAYYALLGGLDGVIAAGGIAEHAPAFVRDSLKDLEHLGIVITDDDSNTGLSADSWPDGAWRFSAPDSSAACWCVRVDENRSMLDSVIEHMQSEL